MRLKSTVDVLIAPVFSATKVKFITVWLTNK